MYYLGSRVVGRAHVGAEPAERDAVPDIVVPRREQRARSGLVAHLASGDFTRTLLPVRDVAYNNIPEVYAGRVLDTVHRSRTPLPADESEALAIWERRPRASE